MEEMSNQLPLILAVADLAYSGGELFDVLSSRLEKYGVRANVQTIPLADVVETIRRLQPDLVVIGHRPLLDDLAMCERWKAAGSPMGGDIIKALKSDLDTRDIPVLLIEAYHKIEQLAQECGADAYLRIPTGPKEFGDAIGVPPIWWTQG
jgi:CheY-like chemotaxis protein